MEAKELQDAVVTYLKAKGWKPIVVGEVVIQQQPDARQFNYEVMVRVTAKSPETDDQVSDLPIDSPKADTKVNSEAQEGSNIMEER